VALPQRKPDPAKPDPISQGVGDYLSGQNNQAENILKKTVSSSEIRGSGLTKVTDLIAQIGRQMVDQVAANTNLEMETKEMLDQEVANAVAETIAEKEAEELLADEFNINSAANDNVEMPDSGINPTDAINSFGADPTDSADSLSTDEAANDDQEIPDDSDVEPDQAEPVYPEQLVPSGVEGSRGAPQKKDRMQQGADKAADNRSANKNAESTPNSEQAETKPEEEATPSPTETPTNAENPGETPEEKQPEREQEKTKQGAPTPEGGKTESDKSNPSADEERKKEEDDAKSKEDAPEKAKERESEGEKKPEEPTPEEKPPEPEKNPMTANQDDQASLGEPLVKTDDAGHPQPRGQNGQNQEQASGQTNPNASGQNQNSQSGQPQNQTTTDPNQNATQQQTSGQNLQQRGILMQKFNERRNKQLIAEIDKKAEQLNQDKKKLQKEIKTIDEFLKPLEREHKALTIASWTLLAIEILIKVLAAILAATIIFLFIVPIAPMVWTASNIPQVLRKAVDLKIADLDKKMEKKKKERDEKRKKLKNISQQIAKLAQQRFRIINQSLLTTLKQQRSKQQSAV